MSCDGSSSEVWPPDHGFQLDGNHAKAFLFDYVNITIMFPYIRFQCNKVHFEQDTQRPTLV